MDWYIAKLWNFMLWQIRGGEFQVLIFPFTPLWRKCRILNSLEGFYYALIKTIANNSIAPAIPERFFFVLDK